MKITIVLPYNTWSGAFRSTYELANQMVSRGHDVEVCIPFLPYLEGHSILSVRGLAIVARGLVRSVVRGNRVPWFDLKAPVRLVPRVNDRFMRDADVVMANHWPTTFDVARLSPSKGRKFNFIRDTDPWSPHHQWEQRSFRLPMRRLVVAPWLKDFLEDKMQLEAAVVPNGTNTRLFTVEHRLPNPVPIVGMLYYDHPAKGMANGFAVLNAVKARHPEVRFVLFGWKRPPSMPPDSEFHLRPVKERLRDIYAKIDIFISPSLQEGYHNPPREAMAAECALVATRVGSVPLCTIPGETALVVEPGDVPAMTEAVCDLIRDPERRLELARRGREHIARFRWEDSADELLRQFMAS